MRFSYKHLVDVKKESLTRPDAKLFLQSLGSVAEWSKALVLGTSHFGGVGSNPTTIKNFKSTVASSNWPNSEWENQRYYILGHHRYWIERSIIVVNINGSLGSAFVLAHEEHGSDLWWVSDFKKVYFEIWKVRQPGIEPGSIAWKATMLTFTPPTLYTSLNVTRLLGV